MRPQPECPECEKLASVSEESQGIGEFLEWLKRKYDICEFHEPHGAYYPTRKSTNDYLADYFKIDLNKVEKECRALLEWIQEQYEENN